MEITYSRIYHIMLDRELQEAINQSYGSVLSLVSKDKYGWEHPKIPIRVMDPQTHQLVQIDDLFNAINFTRTLTGSLVLRRSINQPMTDAALITEKQCSLAELRADPQLRAKVTGFVEGAVKDENLLYSHYRGDYTTHWSGNPNIYDATKGSIRLLGYLAQNLEGVTAQTNYLNALMGNFRDLKEDDVYKFIKGPVYRTPRGLKPKEEVGLLTPNLRFFKTDYKPIRLLIQGGPIPLIVTGIFSSDPNLMISSAYGGIFYAVWPYYVTNLGRGFDNKMYGKPLGEKYFGNSNVVNAIESLGRIDELLSLSDYADCLQVPVALPQVEDVPQHYFEARDLRNPVLTKNNPEYVGNDVCLNGARLTFLTGPNSGGKTSLSKTILQAQVLAQIGSYIPAEQAKVAIADGIYYHSPMINSLQDEEGRFGVEIVRTRNIFFKTTPKSLVVLDELIEATTYKEKIENSRKIMDGFWAIGGNTVLVTHNYELAEHFRDRGLGQFWQVEFDGDKPTHRIIRGISLDSHAEKVMERLRFSGEDIQRHLRERGYVQ